MLRLTEQPFTHINPYEHTGLSLDDIVKLKSIIDNEQSLPYKYFVTMTWRPATELDYDDGKLYEAKRKEDWRRYLQKLSWETTSHIKSFGAISLPHMNRHVHSILLSEKPITGSMAKRLWRHGEPAGKDFGEYNPRWAEDNGCQDLTRGALKYIHGKHHEHERLYFGRIFCPAVRKCCRKGRCPYRNEIGGETTKTKLMVR